MSGRMEGVSYQNTKRDEESYHAVIQREQEIISRPLYILALSGSNDIALEESLVELQKNITSNKEKSLDTLEYFTNLTAGNLKWKAVVIAGSVPELLTNIQKRIFLKGDTNKVPSRKICFLFPGYSAVNLETTKTLYNTSKVFRTHFDYCMLAFKKCQNAHEFLTAFASQYALLMLWDNWGVKANYVLGHSMGEFVAGVCAGRLSVDEAINILIEIDRRHSTLAVGKNLIVRASECQIMSLWSTFCNTEQTKREIEVTVVNSKIQCVVGGDPHDIETFSQFCTNRGIKCTNMAVPVTLHSSSIDPLVLALREITEKFEQKTVQSHNPGYISSVKGRYTAPEELDGVYWARLLRDKVIFEDACSAAIELGCATFVEIGHHPILSPIMMANAEKDILCLPSIRNGEENWKTLLNSLGRLYMEDVCIDWVQFHNI